MALLTKWEGEPVLVLARRWDVPLLEVHDVLGSTNDRAGELAREGAPAHTVVLAEEQTAGRGRSGAPWHSAPGAGLWMSTLLPVGAPIPPFLPLLIGLAAARAAESTCPGLCVGLKWPNDLEIGGRKVGGVLCERSHGPVVAGVGLNVRQKPEDFPGKLAERATSLEAMAGSPVSRGSLAEALVAALRHLLTPELTSGARAVLPDDLRRELSVRDVLRDRRVRTDQAGEGTARGVDADGALLMEREGGARVRVVAGSVRIA